MEGYVVPVGHKFSKHKDNEWRISYTTAEKKLVRSMNGVQVKVYVVQKDRLKPVCKNFSSYMVKNLVFWLLEMTSISDFTPETLVDRILSAFYYLQQCLEFKYLPCYIIIIIIITLFNEGYIIKLNKLIYIMAFKTTHTHQSYIS